MTGRQNIAVVVAHPDDEVLGFGGVMARHGEAGDEVHVLFLSTGLAARGAPADEAAFEELRVQARAAGEILGAKDIQFADFPDNAMDGVPLLDVVKRVETFVAAARPDIVYTHHAGDLNVDHGVTARAVLTACRPLPGSRVRKIYAGEVPSSSEYGAPDQRFAPTSYVAIADFIQHKCRALTCYASEIRDFPHPRSPEALTALARMRGAECGIEAAEAFVLLREIER